MALDTQPNLVTAIAAALHRSDLTAQIPDFITLAESYLRRELNFPSAETLGTVTITAGAQFGALPTLFSSLRSPPTLALTPVVQLDVLTPQIMSQRYTSLAAGQPVACAIIGTNLYVNCATDTAYTVNVDYWADFAALTAAAPTNWLLTKYPDAYYYATLLQSAPWLGADNRIETWGRFAQRSIDGINLQGMIQGYGPLEAQLTANVA